MGNQVSYSVALERSKPRKRGEETTHHAAKCPWASEKERRVVPGQLVSMKGAGAPT